ncbi:sigma-70 family RNA polymerase sigma factor [Peribacillus sp. FSL H8-0477]|uniref:sigma-70 family RNA polymerase sigma factor n=1 Tax=Peribacillus sp. FSL H8-0477 TaxID=2921388 RepID=UPI0030F6C660
MKDLVMRAVEGDDAAFTELMDRHKIQLYKMAYSYLRNEDDAVEALQEVTFRAYRALKKIKNPDFFSTWLIRILLNYCMDVQKSKKRMIVDIEKMEQAAVYQNHKSIEIEQAMKEMETKQRELLELKYFHELKITEIAELWQCPEGTVKTRLYKALKILKSKLEAKGDASNV